MTAHGIAVFTSGRQDWGILAPVCRVVQDRGLPLDLFAGGMHGRDGQTVRDLDGWPLAAFVAACADGSGSASAAQAAAQTIAGLAPHLDPDRHTCLTLVGDRTETLAAALAAICRGLPILHLHGGETTAGAIDDACRHAISMLADRHAVAHAPAAARLRGFGIPADRIAITGAPSLDGLFRRPTPDPAALRLACGVPAQAHPLVLLAYHPATRGEAAPQGIAAILAALDRALPETSAVIACRANNDKGGAVIDTAIAAWCQQRPRQRCLHTALGERWWDLLLTADVLVGNSSSGLIEAPAAGIPVLDIGHRQDGRLCDDSVIRLPAETAVIAAVLRSLLAVVRPSPRQARASLYGDGQAADRVVDLMNIAPAVRGS